MTFSFVSCVPVKNFQPFTISSHYVSRIRKIPLTMNDRHHTTVIIKAIPVAVLSRLKTKATVMEYLRIHTKFHRVEMQEKTFRQVVYRTTSRAL